MTEDTPEISIIVVVYNMAREAPRTLLSLSAAYQRDIDPKKYEVIIVDNGSTPPLDPKIIANLAGNFRLIRIDHAPVSPVVGINQAIAAARGRLIGVMIDGARIATPGLIATAASADRIANRAVILTVSFHLGPKFQWQSMREGYDQKTEDLLLEGSGWVEDGYRLFDISTFAGSSSNGWFKPLAESNALFMSATLWGELGGLDERFVSPGGGLANLDLLSRAVALPEITAITLLGEATFHQFHGGIATNAIVDPGEGFHREYGAIRGHGYKAPTYRTLFIGSVPPNVLRWLRLSSSEEPSIAGASPSSTNNSQSQRDTRAPEISIVVVVHNMAREAPRTLYSLSAAYQRDIGANEYEVIVVDNGSQPRLDPDMVAGLDGNFRLIRLEPAPPSPAHAVNVGLAAARSDIIGVMIDGARLVTPGFLHFARGGMRLYPRAVVVTLGWYLGRDQQRWAIEGGYDQRREDELLASVEWPKDGYRLFDIAAFDESSIDGWFGTIAESNGLFLSRESWDRLGGMDERFDPPGGGFVNIDTLIRAIELPDSEPVVLLGEGTFHQLHGGIATNANYRTFPNTVAKWHAQYQDIRGKSWISSLIPKRTYLGSLPQSVLVHFARGILEPVVRSPLGTEFDRSLWQLEPLSRPSDSTIASLLDLAVNELRARRFEACAVVARMARAAAPNEPGPQRLLQIVGPWLKGQGIPPDDRRPEFHLARARAHELLGESEGAKSEYRAALARDLDLPQAHLGLSQLRWPGEGYLSWLGRLHSALQPRTYLEIGVGNGQSLALAQPPTLAIGIDPSPKLDAMLNTECHLFCESSDTFFATPKLTTLLAGRPLDLAFIDGLHRFEQALTDFINIEAYCGPGSVVLFHDTLPLDEPTQRRQRGTSFWTGDVWKTILCLKHFRPDLAIFTIATPPTGLTVIGNLDPRSRVLADRFGEARVRFIDLPFFEVEDHLSESLNVIPNAWSSVEERLRGCGVLDGAKRPIDRAL